MPSASYTPPEQIGKLGALPPAYDARTVQLAPILAKDPMPVVPFARNWGNHYSSAGLPGAEVKLDTFGNLIYGNCTCAAFGHYDQVASHHFGPGYPASIQLADVLDAYDAISAWDQTKPLENDRGARCLDALKYFRNKRLIQGFAEVDFTKRDHVQIAVNFLHGLYLALDLPLAWQTMRVWDAAPIGANGRPADARFVRRSWGGHAVTVVGYGATGVIVATWGYLKHITWAGLMTYGSEAYVPIHRHFDRQHPKPTPSGYLADRILRAVDQIAA